MYLGETFIKRIYPNSLPTYEGDIDKYYYKNFKEFLKEIWCIDAPSKTKKKCFEILNQNNEEVFTIFNNTKDDIILAVPVKFILSFNITINIRESNAILTFNLDKNVTGDFRFGRLSRDIFPIWSESGIISTVMDYFFIK